MNELIDFCLDTENPEKNYKLAQWYEKQNHTASAHVYYFRAAERTENKNFAYTSLLRSSVCYKSQGKRDATEKLLIHAALSFLTERPEAYYFLSLFYERKEEWDQCYLYADFGLKCYENEVESIDLPEYQGKYALIYQKALASWWWGRGEESKKLFQLLKDEYWNVMNSDYKNLINEKMNAFFGISDNVEKEYTKKTINLNNSILEIYEMKEKKSEFDWGLLSDEDKNIIRKEIFEENIYEKYFSVKENDIVMDIGANVGAFSYSILDKKPKHIYCVEPSTNLINIIKNNLKGFPVTIIDSAVSNENSNSKELSETDWIHCHEGNYKSKTFKKILQENNIDHIDFLKIDCEGGEYDVFTEENKDFILSKVKYISGEWHFVANDNSMRKFKTFTELYLKNHNNYKVFELSGKEITDMIFNDDYLIPFEKWYKENGHAQLMIYIENKDLKVSNNEEVVEPNTIRKKIGFDVGACVGETISKFDGFDKIYAFEPAPHVFNILVEKHKNDPRIEFYEMAISDEDGVKSLKYHYNYGYSSFLEIDKEGEFAKKCQEFDPGFDNIVSIIDVQTKRIDTFMQENCIEHIDFLKIDTQGNDLNVIKSLGKMIDKVDTIELEVQIKPLYKNSSSKEEIVDFMQKNNFNLISEEANNFLLKDYEERLTFKQKKDKSFFSINEYKKSTSWIVDNFYNNPDEIRKFALEQEFGDESVITGFVGRRTFNQFLFPGLKEAFESVMGKKITKWEEHGMNGRFQICWSGERLVYHCDSQRWGGMIYLTPNAPFQCGTTLYADKKNRARTYYDQGWDEYWANTPGDCHLDRTPFEPVDVFGNVYNRLVIFDASCIHSASEYFGTNKENARLWQMFFFDTED